MMQGIWRKSYLGNDPCGQVSIGLIRVALAPITGSAKEGGHEIFHLIVLAGGLMKKGSLMCGRKDV
jgi:hypothetical protein